MKSLSNILLWNFAIMFGMMALFYFLSKWSGESLAGESLAILMIYTVPVHASINFVIAIIQFFRQKRREGLFFILAGVLVFVIGFSACVGAAMM